MKRKILSFLLILTLIITAMPLTGIDFTDLMTAFAVGTKNNYGFIGDWYYTTNFTGFEEYGGAKISIYKANEKNVVIPSEINGIPVTCVGSLWTDKEMHDKYPNRTHWFDTSNIESVVVPESVKELSGSFRNLTNLKSVTLPEGLEVIGGRTFENCTNLTEINIPDSVVEISGSAFTNSGINIKGIKEITEIAYWGEQDFDFQGYTESEEIVFNSPKIEFANLSLAEVDKIICNGYIYFFLYYKETPNIVVNKDLEIVCNGGIWSDLHYRYTRKMGLYAHYNEKNGAITYNSVPVDNVTEYESGDYRYYLNSDNEAVISRYLGKDSEVIVPETIDGYTVGEIGTSAFAGGEYDEAYFDIVIDKDQITSIVLPETVKKIGAFAFEYNTSLVSVDFPDAVRLIPSNSFERCYKLKNIDWPASLEVIGPMAFYECNGLTDIQIPEGVTEIGSNAFGGCSNLQGVSLPETLTSLGYYAFIEDEKLESISIPDSVTEIGDGVFMGCSSLTSAKLPANIEVIPNSLFYCTNLESIDIPETVTKIEDNVFDATKLSEVKLPENLKNIGAYAFSCTDLTEINLPLSVKHIGKGAFSYNLFESFVIDWQTISKIPAETFRGCDNLKRVEIKGEIKEIGVKAFNGCNALEEIIIGDNVEKIHNSAFEYCTALETVTIPEGIDYMATAAFKNCSNLKTLYFNATECIIGLKNHSNVDRNKQAPFYGCGITDLHIGDKVEYLDWFLFASLKSLVNLEIPENVKYIGECTFLNCTALQNVMLPDSLEYIDDYAFDLCSSLVEITIPTNLKVLGYCAFSRCNNLTTVYFNATNCKVTNYAGEITIPEEWATASPFYETKITNIIFGENVTAISSQSDTYGTFESCETLETVSIPNTVEEIGTAAFKNCTNLETAVIPDSVTEISDDAFDGCDNLTIYCSETSYAYSYATANNISVSTFIISAIPNKTYTGNAIKPAVTVTVSNTILTKDVDYTVSYSNNINVGQATVVVRGIGDYEMFSSRANFAIVTKSIASAGVADIAVQDYTGSEVTPAITVTDGANILREGTDYTVTYKDNIKSGTATAVIKGRGNYSGTKTVNFEIEQLDPIQNIINELISFFNSIIAKIKAFFAQFTIIRR